MGLPILTQVIKRLTRQNYLRRVRGMEPKNYKIFTIGDIWLTFP